MINEHVQLNDLWVLDPEVNCPAQCVSRPHRDLRRPAEVHPINSAINSNTVSHTCCAFTTSSPSHHPRFLTFVLWLRAGDDPFNQAALHQSFPREPRLLPLPRILHSARRRLDAIGISQQAAVDHLAIRLEDEGERERVQVDMEMKQSGLRSLN